MAKREYDVGYGKPPKHTQFAAGASGNPKGRKKGAKGLKTDLREEMREKVVITENGRRITVTKQRLIIKAITRKAAEGNVAAADRLVALHIQMFGFEDERVGKAQLSTTDQAILDDILRSELSVAPGDAPADQDRADPQGEDVGAERASGEDHEQAFDGHDDAAQVEDEDDGY